MVFGRGQPDYIATGQPMSLRLSEIQTAGILFLLVALPLALGGVLPGARALLVAGTATLIGLEWLPRVLRGNGPEPREKAWLGLWLVVMALLAVQLLPLPQVVIAQLGAYTDAYRSLSDLPLERLSPVPERTFHLAAIFTAYWMIAWMVARLPSRNLGWIAAGLIGIASFQALYGILTASRQEETIFGLWSRRSQLGDATGSFANHNHFAGLLALAWPVGLAQLGFGGASRRRRPARLACAFLFFLVVAVALVASHSRMGLLAALAGLSAWLLFSPDLARIVAAPRRSWLAGVMAAAGVAGVIWFGMAPLVERFLELPTSQERFVVWRALQALPPRTWILGAGAGAFQDVFKMVQPAGMATSFAYAHNDWIEFLLDFGLVGTGVIAIATGFWWKRVRPVRFGRLQRAALAGIFAIAVHSLADFDLHVPGTALAFWVLVGVACNEHRAPTVWRQPAHVG